MRLTIVDDYTWYTESYFHSGKCSNDGLWIGEVALDVELVSCAVRVFDASGCDSNLVAFGCERLSDVMAYVRACAEDERNGSVSGHFVVCSEPNWVTLVCIVSTEAEYAPCFIPFQSRGTSHRSSDLYL